MKNRIYVIEVELEHGEAEASGLLKENAQDSYPGIVSTVAEATRYATEDRAESVCEQLIAAARATYPDMNLRAEPVRCLIN